MKKAHILLFLFGLAVSSCGGTAGENFSFDRDVPDEFSVTRKPSLTRPPDLFLRPPRTVTREEDLRVEGVLELIAGKKISEKEENFTGTPALKNFLKEMGVFEDDIPRGLRELIENGRKDKLDEVDDRTIEDILSP